MDEYVGSLFLATTTTATATSTTTTAVQETDIVTNGGQNNNIGNDETPIAFIQFSLIHTKNKQVLWTVSQLVKGETEEEEDVNGNDLSEEFNKSPSEFPEADNPPVSLATAVHVITQAIEASSLASPVRLLVTDGEHPLRQCFHPQAKDIPDLPDLFFSFLDLRKLAKKYHPHHHQQVNNNNTFSEEGGGGEEEEEDSSSSVVETISQQLVSEEEGGGGGGDCTKNNKNIHKINNVFLHLLENPVLFDEETLHPETIQTKLEAGICTKGENVDGNCVVRARGLPWQSSDQDVARFFRGLNIAKGGVALCLSAQGRRNGEALVRFESSYQRDLGLKRHKHHIGSRYIEVYKASGEDFISVAGGCNNEAHVFLSKGAQVIVRMRGLPYDCSHQQVIDFFENGGEGEETSCSVLEKEEGVLFVKRPDGRATGDAFVLFQDEEDAAKALAKHKQSIGPRYIELFRSTAAEVQQVLNRCVEPPPPLPQQVVSSPLNHHHLNINSPHHHHQHHHQQQYLNLSTVNSNNKSSLPSPELIHAAAAAAAAAAQHNHHHHLPLLHHHQLAPLSPPLLTHPGALSPPTVTASSSSSSSSVALPQQHLITSGTRKDCIRLRGLPYEAQVEHILEFLGEYAKNIVYQGVHMVYNAQGQPSGEAFIQMDSETSAFLSAQGKHHRYMMHFKKQRYIEVFQCSGFDMQQVLSGGGGGGQQQQQSLLLKDHHHHQQSLSAGGLYYIQQQLRQQQEQQPSTTAAATTTTTVFYYYPPPPPHHPHHPYFNQIPYTTNPTTQHHHHQDLMKQQEKLSIRLGLA